MSSSNNPGDMRPDILVVVLSRLLTRQTERCARVASKDEIKASSKSFCREGPQVRPHSLDSHLTLFSLSNQVRQGVGFELHCNDSKRVRQCAGQSEFETAVPGAKRQNRDVLGIIHIPSSRGRPATNPSNCCSSKLKECPCEICGISFCDNLSTFFFRNLFLTPLPACLVSCRFLLSSQMFRPFGGVLKNFIQRGQNQ